MNNSSREGFYRLLQLSFIGTTICFIFCGCPSALIMASGLTEDSIFGTQGSPETRANIVKKLGQPIQTLQFSPPIHADEIGWNTGGDPSNAEWKANHRRRILTMDRWEKGSDGKGHVVRPNPKITHVEKFQKMGRITPYGYAGDNMAVSSATIGLAEIVAIPATIVYKTTGGNTKNTLWVWFDSNDSPVAYEWEFLSSDK